MADLNTTKGSGRWQAVTPSDTVDLPEVPRGIILRVAGDVVMIDSKSNQVTFTLLAGLEYGLHPRRVLSTGTTATGIVALY